VSRSFVLCPFRAEVSGSLGSFWAPERYGRTRLRGMPGGVEAWTPACFLAGGNVDSGHIVRCLSLALNRTLSVHSLPLSLAPALSLSRVSSLVVVLAGSLTAAAASLSFDIYPILSHLLPSIFPPTRPYPSPSPPPSSILDPHTPTSTTTHAALPATYLPTPTDPTLSHTFSSSAFYSDSSFNRALRPKLLTFSIPTSTLLSFLILRVRRFV